MKLYEVYSFKSENAFAYYVATQDWGYRVTCLSADYMTSRKSEGARYAIWDTYDILAHPHEIDWLAQTIWFCQNLF